MNLVRVYKFYSARWGIDALYRQRLKIATDRDINDPFEFLAAGRDKVTRSEAKRLRKELFQKNGIISFCKNWSEPLLWSHYAENHRGIALGFDIPKWNCFDVRYTHHRVWLPDENSDSYVFGEKLDFWQSIKVTKSSRWEYESESRVFPPLETAVYENGLYFWRFQDLGNLKEIIIGADYEGGKNSSLHKKLTESGVRIRTARLAFKDFSVRAQMATRLQKYL